MKLKLHRTSFSDKATEGNLSIDGIFQCYTLEDADRFLEDGTTKFQDETAIPRGSYKVEIDVSTRFKRLMPHLLNVTGFTGIRIHYGNTSEDTAGCILVGTQNTSQTDNFIGNSRDAFKELMDKLIVATANNEEIEIEIL